jgi:IclR family acetate operon transcriptional repressor
MNLTERDKEKSMIFRVSEVLKTFHFGEKSLTVTEIATRSAIPKASAARIVTELIHFGFLERDQKGVRLGLRLFELGQLANRSADLRQFTYQSMLELGQATGQTVHLAVLDGTEVVYVQILRGKNAPPLPSRVGGRLPAYATGVGKALLAYAPESVLEEIQTQGLKKIGPRTIDDISKLKTELESIRINRLAFETEESSANLACSAAPIIQNGKAIAAISVTVDIRQMDVTRVGPAVSAVARALSRNAAKIN